jgi:hypothetical protein
LIISWASIMVLNLAHGMIATSAAFVRVHFSCALQGLSGCGESLRLVGLAVSACLFTSSPSPSRTADSSAALRATAPVRSLVYFWPCSAPLQPLLRAAFPSHSLPYHFLCTSLIHHSLSCLISHFSPRFQHAFQTALCPV